MDERSGSALREMRRLAGLVQTGLLALDDAGVTAEQAGLLGERAVGVEVDRVVGAGHAQAQRAGLAGDATAVDAGDDVEATLEVRRREGLVDDLLVQLVREVGVERATVDGPGAGAGDDPDPRHGLLAAAGGGRRGALGAVGDALLVGLVGLLDPSVVSGVLSHLRVLVSFVVGSHWETCEISNGLACWAWWGWCGPE